jgi:hypothetical protein
MSVVSNMIVSFTKVSRRFKIHPMFCIVGHSHYPPIVISEWLNFLKVYDITVSNARLNFSNIFQYFNISINLKQVWILLVATFFFIPFFALFIRRWKKVNISNALNVNSLSILIQEMRQMVDVLTQNCELQFI